MPRKGEASVLDVEYMKKFNEKAYEIYVETWDRFVGLAPMVVLDCMAMMMMRLHIGCIDAAEKELQIEATVEDSRKVVESLLKLFRERLFALGESGYAAVCEKEREESGWEPN